MQNTKKSLFLLLALGVTASIFAACGTTTTPTDNSTAGSTNSTNSTTPAQQPATNASPTTQKVGVTTKTGKILNLEGKYYIQETGKQPSQIDTYSLDFKPYVGQTVTISGEYSGDTLFVTKIQ